ncbi:MAG: hypothetical protein HQL84_18955 [Magnetococcales bacterium]|nr:hypothetical protein [Magnetococcales bacterium]
MLSFADRVREQATVSGLGTHVLAGAVSGHQGFVAGVGDGSWCAYCAEAGPSWEVGEGVVDAASGTLSRERILSSSNAGAAVDWPAGSVVAVFCVAPAAVYRMIANTGVSVTTPGMLQVLIGTSRWYPPQAVSFNSMEAWVGTASAGSALQFALNKNNVAIATGSIAAGNHRMAVTPVTLDLTPSDWLTLDVTQVGSSIPGSDLTVRLHLAL